MDLIAVVLVVGVALSVCFFRTWRALTSKNSGPCGGANCKCSVVARPKIVKNK